MASASSFNVSVLFRSSSPTSSLSPSYNETLSLRDPPNLLIPPYLSLSSSFRPVLTYSRRRTKSTSSVTSKKKKNMPCDNGGNDDNLVEDAFEALFQQLEEDLKNDEPSALDGDEEISEEDLAMLERELEEALGDDDELLRAFNSIVDESQLQAELEGTDNEDELENGEEEEQEEQEDDDDEEEKTVVLKNWQLRRLAYALKDGRRKTSIKTLSAEVCLDRAFVLELLRDPPPKLLLMSASLPDRPASVVKPETKQIEAAPVVTPIETEQAEAKVKLPVHIMQSSWSAQKRIKKAQVETLERVYGRTKRPTNAMISSIVHVTNLPRKRVVKWFEDKRAEDEVPDRRLPYQRSASETVFTS